jgi:murein DD-endopeptidase MepM/ murein hydrolase activator NlpD
MAPPKIKPLPGRPSSGPKVKTLPAKKGDDLDRSIDEYLNGRGSPMTGLGASFVQAGRRHGVDPRLLVGIGVIESGAGKYEKHPRNFANWGVHRGVTYDSYEEAIDDLARGLRKGYISKGLKTPRQIVSRYAPSSDGNDEGNWAEIVGSVVQQLGGNPGSVARRPQSRRSLSSGGSLTSPPSPVAGHLGKVTGGVDAMALAQALLAGEDPLEALTATTTPFTYTKAKVPKPRSPVAAPAPGLDKPQAEPISAKNGFLQAPSSFSGTHITDGLDLNKGKRTARDIMARPGTAVGAPEGGVIVRHGSAQGGQALYFQSDSGHLYWMGHIDNMVPVGTRVERGQPIATISSDHAAPHLHIDRR